MGGPLVEENLWANYITTGTLEVSSQLVGRLRVSISLETYLQFRSAPQLVGGLGCRGGGVHADGVHAPFHHDALQALGPGQDGKGESLDQLHLHLEGEEERRREGA